MDPADPSVAMLYQDPHPAHRGFAEAIGADLVDYTGFGPERLAGSVVGDVVNGFGYPEYDVFILEGSRPLYAGMVAKAVQGARLIYLCADHGLYSLGQSTFQGDSAVKTAIGRFGLPVVRRVSRWGIDGVIAVSGFAAEFTRPFLEADTPVEVVHPYIQPEVYRDLEDVEPEYGAKVAVTVGRAAAYKGVDLLVEAWPSVRRSHPQAELHIVGEGHPDSYTDVAGVRVRGYVPSLVEAFEPASLYVQPSRMDTFPVSVLEALRAGLPAVVTSTTGTRSVVRSLDPELVVDPDPDRLAEAISAYFDRSAGDRRNMGARAKEAGAEFEASRQQEAFAEAYDAIIERL